MGFTTVAPEVADKLVARLETRSANVEMWTSPKVREVITRRRITLTNYRELTQR